MTRFLNLRYLALRAGLLALLFSFTSCQEYLDDILGDDQDQKDLPKQIVLTQPGLFPEGIEFNPNTEQFLVSSLTQGTIGTVSDKGKYEPFVEDEDLVATIGIQVDELRQRLLVCNSDPFNANLAALGIYDLRSGGRIAYADLGAVSGNPDAPHFANDVAVDLAGNAYVTDSFYPVIYKVDREGNASVFLQDAAFQPSAGAFGLNGIVYHPLGYLIAAFSETGTLYKIPLDDPEDFTEIEVNMPLGSPDGLYLSSDLQTLLVVNNAGGSPSGQVLALESDNLWETATVEDTADTGAVFPTTATEREGVFYVLYAHLNELFTGDTSRDRFEIKKLPF